MGSNYYEGAFKDTPGLQGFRVYTARRSPARLKNVIDIGDPPFYAVAHRQKRHALPQGASPASRPRQKLDVLEFQGRLALGQCGIWCFVLCAWAMHSMVPIQFKDHMYAPTPLSI